MATTKSWHSHWLYYLSHTILSSYEPTDEISRENEYKPMDESRHSFMDDMTISIKTAIEAKWTLKEIRAYQLD